MARVDEMERVREMAEDKRRSVRMAEGPTAPRMRERYGKQADALEALLTRLQAYEAVVEAARAVSVRIDEQQAVETAYACEEADEEEMFTATAAVYGAQRPLTRALASLPDEGER